MADRNQLYQALKNADAAGDVDAATKLANAIKQMDASPPAADASLPSLFTRGATAGLSDYVGAAGTYAANHMIGKGELSYNDALKMERQGNANLRDQSPVSAYGSEIAGGITSPIFRGAGQLVDKGLAKAGAMLGRQIPRYVGYGAQGATAGAIAGAGNAEGQGGGIPSAVDVAKSSAVNGAVGLGTGIAIPAAMEVGAKVVGKIANVLSTKAPAMSQEQFKQAATAGYKAAEDAGVAIKPESFQKFADLLPSELNGFHPKVTPGAANIVSVLQEEAANGPITLSMLDKLRSIASGASITRDANEARLAGNIAGKIDDFIENLKPEDLAVGADKAREAIDALTNARSLWKTYSKMKTITDIIDTGEHLNDANWVKGRFRAIVKKPSVFNRYTPDEQKAISDIAETGKLEKILKFIPWRGIQMTTTYAEPMAQASKVTQLQDLIARGGKSSPPRFSPSPAMLGRSASLYGRISSPFITGSSNQ